MPTVRTLIQMLHVALERNVLVDSVLISTNVQQEPTGASPMKHVPMPHPDLLVHLTIILNVHLTNMPLSGRG